MPAPEADHSRKELVHALTGGIRRFAVTATTPDQSLVERILESRMTRGAFAVGSILGTAGAAFTITHPELVEFLFHHPNKDVLNGAKELLDILNSQPSEEQLRGKIVNRGKRINLEAARQQVIANTHGEKTSLRVRALGLGDSNFYTYGLKSDGIHGHPDPQNQPHSFTQVSRNVIAPHLRDIGVSSWESYTFAVPGAPSGPGYPGDSRQYGLMGPEQFGNEDFQRLLRGQKGEEDVLNIVTISATGDDWRMLMENAMSLAHFFSNLKNIEKATKADVEQFKSLLAESNRIAASYGDHMQQCLTQIDLINEERRKNGLLDVKVVIAHPFSMLGTEHIPFRTLAGDDDKVKGLQDILVKVNPDDPHDDRHYLDITKIPYGQKIAYLVTVAMYQQLAQRMGKAVATNPDFVIPLEWMGLERAQDFFFIDGHPGEDGTPMQSALFLNLFEGVSQRIGDTATLDQVAQLPPDIVQIIDTVTHAKAA